MNGIFPGNHPVYEAASLAFSALFEGKGMVCRIIDGTRDYLVSRGMPKDQANDTVLKVRQMFFDPLASPGHHPTTDPDFKKMLPLFHAVTMLMVNVFNYGTSRYDRERAENFAPRFVEYAREHFREGPPRMEMSEFIDLVKEIDSGKPAFSPDPEDYSYVQVSDWEELKELSGTYRLGEWCNVRSEEDWNRYSLHGRGRFYLLFTDDAAGTYGKLSVIGITVNHYGKIVYAFDRDNDCVDKDAVLGIAEYYGLNRPFAVDFGTGVDLVNAGCRYEDVFPYAKEIGPRHAVVGFDHTDEMCILDTVSGRYASGIFERIDTVSGCDNLFILDGAKLYDLGRERVIIDVYDHDGFRIDTEGYDRDEMLYWICGDGSYRQYHVNAVSLDDDRPSLLLDEANRTPVASVSFNTANGTSPTVERMAAGDFWVVETSDGKYIVTRPGMKLDECTYVPDRSGNAWNEVLTPEGYYVSVIDEGPGRRVYYLMKDGGRVVDTPFVDAGRDREDSYDIFLVTESGEQYIFHPETGKLQQH